MLFTVVPAVPMSPHRSALATRFHEGYASPEHDCTCTQIAPQAWAWRVKHPRSSDGWASIQSISTGDTEGTQDIQFITRINKYFCLVESIIFGFSVPGTHSYVLIDKQTNKQTRLPLTILIDWQANSSLLFGTILDQFFLQHKRKYKCVE